jgi:hypothetical protein
MPRVPGPSFALALGMVAFIGPLAVHLFFPVIPAVKAAFGLSPTEAMVLIGSLLCLAAVAVQAVLLLSGPRAR